jgi:hypothetical protein
MKKNLAATSATYAQLKTKIQHLINLVKQLESNLEKAGALYTPGRF